MKAEDALNTIRSFRQLCEESVFAGEFSEDAYKEIIRGCDVLRQCEYYEIWGESLVRMIEDFDNKVDLSVGWPGYFGHALESGGLEASCKLYIVSLKRQPTGLIAGLAEAAYRSGKTSFGLEVFESILSNPSSDVAAIEIAEMALEN